MTVADCIDAATDNNGRPYGMGKTLEQLMTEFDAGRYTRYCAYVVDLLRLEEIQQRIHHIINDRRSELYYDLLCREE